MGKTGYYAKQGVYFLPGGSYRDHPIYHDMKHHNLKFDYKPGLTDTKIAKDMVFEDQEGWTTTRDMRTMSRNFTSLTKEQLEERAMRKHNRLSSSVVSLK